MSHYTQQRLSRTEYNTAVNSPDPGVRHAVTLRDNLPTDSVLQCVIDRDIQNTVGISGHVEDAAYQFNNAMINNPLRAPVGYYPGCTFGLGIMTSSNYTPPGDSFHHVTLPRSGAGSWSGYVPWNPNHFGRENVWRDSNGGYKISLPVRN